MPETTRLGNVLTMVLDGIRFLDLDQNSRTVRLKTHLAQPLEQCGLKRNRSQPPRTVGLKIHNHVPHHSNDQKDVANDMLWTCFDDGFGWVSISGILRKGPGRVNQAGCEQCALSVA